MEDGGFMEPLLEIAIEKAKAKTEREIRSCWQTPKIDFQAFIFAR